MCFSWSLLVILLQAGLVSSSRDRSTISVSGGGRLAMEGLSNRSAISVTEGGRLSVEEEEEEEGDAAWPKETMTVVTWNIAAINNNPFEYWIKPSGDPAYDAMMFDVENYISDDNRKEDPLIKTFFTPGMLAELMGMMSTSGFTKVHAAAAEFTSNYMNRRMVADFLKDPIVGKKRLTSMPDRNTNTINLEGGGRAFRPTITNCYAETFDTRQGLADWWAKWKNFMFNPLVQGRDMPCDKVTSISRAKYKALTETEEAMSRDLSLMVLAAFDATLVHLLSVVQGGQHKDTWQPIRQQLCQAFLINKFDRTRQILKKKYGNSDVVFLQEVPKAFIVRLQASKLAKKFMIYFAEGDGKRDQNSAILLRKDNFLPEQPGVDLTAKVEAILATNGTKGVAAGDILVLSIKDKDGQDYVVASFHGDTEGLATIPVVTAVKQLLSEDAFSQHQLLFGLDANSYEDGAQLPSDCLDVAAFAEEYSRLGFSSCWGEEPATLKKAYTTNHARTYLQPQLSKAISYKDIGLWGKGDHNPKDFVLFHKGSFDVSKMTKDNTGDRAWAEELFPSLRFPSDHGIVETVLVPKFGKTKGLSRGWKTNAIRRKGQNLRDERTDQISRKDAVRRPKGLGRVNAKKWRNNKVGPK